MKVQSVCVLFLYLYFTSPTNGARILGVFPMASPSHYFLGSALMKGLAEAGHDVTMISPFPLKDLPKNGTWREIVLDEIMDEMKKTILNQDLFKIQSKSLLQTIAFLNSMGMMTTEQMLKHKKMQELMKSNEKFDVVIVTQFINDGMKALANLFNGHLILFSNTAPNSWLNHLVGKPSLPSYEPEMLLGMSSSMNFFRRVQNTFYRLAITLNHHLYLYPKQNELIQKYIPNPVDINDALYNASLVLLNSHPSIFNPQPMVPCMVEIGGFHISPPKELPKDLQQYLDDAKEGAIYFSMGSNLRSDRLPVEKRDALLQAFRKRKEKILWKWEDDVLPGQPPNVKLGKWLPQQEILAHPNVKVFITHGGLLSTTEAVYHGVPIVAIPILGDQRMNANGAQDAGYGIVLPFSELTEEKLTFTLDEIITNSKYRENVEERSRIMRDRQVNPLQNAVYWVEYVIRHNGAKHLRVPYLDLPWYQFYLLDVFAFLSLVLSATYVLVKKACSYICKRRIYKKKVKTN